MGPERIAGAAAVVLMWAMPAMAFDCGKASTAVEKAICANTELKAVDDGLERAYGDVRSSSSKAERKMLARAQKAWIAARDTNCPQSGIGIDGCVRDMTTTRLKLFEGRPESGPGAGARIIPVFIIQAGTETQYDLDITLLRFAEPRTTGQRLFNGVADKIVSRMKLGNHGEDTVGHIYALEEAMVLSHASPDFISVQHSFWSDLGGAHGNGGVENTNIDMQAGKVLGIEDVFSEAAAARLTAACKKQLIAEKTSRSGGGPYVAADDPFLQDEVIAEHVANLGRWSFTAVEASVSFDAYAIGSYAEGSYDCTFPMTEVKTLALPEAPLP